MFSGVIIIISSPLLFGLLLTLSDKFEFENIVNGVRAKIVRKTSMKIVLNIFLFIIIHSRDFVLEELIYNIIDKYIKLLKVKLYK